MSWFARDVADLDLLAEPFALPCSPEPVADVTGLKVAICGSTEWERAGPESQAAVLNAATRLRGAGAAVEALDLPDMFRGLTRAHRVILVGEGRAAFLPLARLLGDRLHDGFHARVENRDGFTPADLVAAYDLAAICRIEFERRAGDFDVVLTPSAPGEAPVGRKAGDPVLNQHWTLLHVPAVNISQFRRAERDAGRGDADGAALDRSAPSGCRRCCGTGDRSVIEGQRCSKDGGRSFGIMDIGVFIPIGNNGWLISENSPQYKPSFDLNKDITVRGNTMVST